MFAYCTGLSVLDLSSFDTSNVLSMSYMFKGCGELNIIYVGDNWTIESVTIGEDMFAGCTKLVGGNGTSYESAGVGDCTYARVDTATTPGYLTLKVGN